jgi:hypothetical protein
VRREAALTGVKRWDVKALDVTKIAFKELPRVI